VKAEENSCIFFRLVMKNPKLVAPFASDAALAAVFRIARKYVDSNSDMCLTVLGVVLVLVEASLGAKVCAKGGVEVVKLVQHGQAARQDPALAACAAAALFLLEACSNKIEAPAAAAAH
jgi:hypothetical protein